MTKRTKVKVIDIRDKIVDDWMHSTPMPVRILLDGIAKGKVKLGVENKSKKE